jgi:hypothetical protein
MQYRTHKELREFLQRIKERDGISQAQFARIIDADIMAINRQAGGRTKVARLVWSFVDLFELRPELLNVMRELRGLRK